MYNIPGEGWHKDFECCWLCEKGIWIERIQISGLEWIRWWCNENNFMCRNNETRIGKWNASNYETLLPEVWTKQLFYSFRHSNHFIFRVEEYWEPQLEGLEQIVATRQIPCVHILLSLDKLDDNTLGSVFLFHLFVCLNESQWTNLKFSAFQTPKFKREDHILGWTSAKAFDEPAKFQ